MMFKINHLVTGLLVCTLIGQSLTAPVSSSDNDATISPSSDDPIEEEKVSSPSDTIIVDAPSGAKGSKGKGNNRLVETISKLRERVDSSRQVLSGIVESFISSPSDDGSKLEESLSKYDDIVEDIEADFTKAKLNFGLQMEKNVDRANKTLEQMEIQLDELNTQFINWSTTNRARMTNQFRQGILMFNDFLSSGVEMLLEASDTGKDVLRNIYRSRNGNKKKPIDDDSRKPGFFIPFLGSIGN